MGDAMGKVSEYIASSEEQRTQQIKMMSQLMRMLDMGTKKNPKGESQAQTDLSLMPTVASRIFTVCSDTSIAEQKFS